MSKCHIILICWFRKHTVCSQFLTVNLNACFSDLSVRNVGKYQRPTENMPRFTIIEVVLTIYFPIIFYFLIMNQYFPLKVSLMLSEQWLILPTFSESVSIIVKEFNIISLKRTSIILGKNLVILFKRVYFVCIKSYFSHKSLT